MTVKLFVIVLVVNKKKFTGGVITSRAWCCFDRWIEKIKGAQLLLADQEKERGRVKQSHPIG